MTPYQAFMKSDHNYNDWYYFVNDLPEMLLSDTNLKRLFDKYSFLMEKKDEISTDFEEQIIYEFEYWTEYIFKSGYTEKMLYDSIYAASNDILQETISKFIPSETQPPAIFSFLNPLIKDDIKNLQAIHDSSFEEEEDNVKNLEFQDGLHQIRNAEVDFEKFEFIKSRLFKLIKEWGNAKIVKPKIKLQKRTSIIKVVEYFDPTIYHIIKKNPELLKTLDWRVFEEMLADILRRLKYTVELTKPTKDGGIDIIAIKKDENFGNHKYLLQAKRSQNAVQVSPVRELLFLHDELKATKSCLATTATFTKGAWKLADIHKWKLELKDQTGIMNWIDKVISG